MSEEPVAAARTDERRAIVEMIDTWAMDKDEETRASLQMLARKIERGDHSTKKHK